MIDFSNFYQLIAKSPLSHWLETLPAQVAAWQRDALHGKFREWERAVEFLPELTPWRCTASISIPNGDPTGNGSAFCRTCPISLAGLSSTWAAAAAITCGG